MSLDPRMLLRGPAAEWEHTAEVPLPGGGSKKMLAVVVESMSNQMLGIIVQNVVQNERRIIPAAKK